MREVVRMRRLSSHTLGAPGLPARTRALLAHPSPAPVVPAYLDLIPGVLHFSVDVDPDRALPSLAFVHHVGKQVVFDSGLVAASCEGHVGGCVSSTGGRRH